MRIKKLTVVGFRGFNEQREIVFHDRLTLISAANSYGKTSISEAFEWLLYGYTSKVEFADSAEEYKGSYRNCHLPITISPTVSLFSDKDGVEVTYSATLSGNSAVLRTDGKVVDTWDFASFLTDSGRPFILQHALKNLLLATPVDRFKRFAELLGLEDLGVIHRDLISFCTKPPLPDRIRELQAEVDSLITRTTAHPGLLTVNRHLKKGSDEFEDFAKALAKHATKYVPAGTQQDSVLLRLLALREEEVSKVFSGSLSLPEFASEQLNAFDAQEKDILGTLSPELMTRYGALQALASFKKIAELEEFQRRGIALLEKEPTKCPFCLQAVNVQIVEHIRTSHAELEQERQSMGRLEQSKGEVKQSLASLRSKVSLYEAQAKQWIKALRDCSAAQSKIEELLRSAQSALWPQLRLIFSDIEQSASALASTIRTVNDAIDVVDVSISTSSEDIKLFENLGISLSGFVSQISELRGLVSARSRTVNEAGLLLRNELDRLAGTQEISVVIDLLHNQHRIKKYFQIIDAVESVKKALKAEVDQYVSRTMLDAISGDFSQEVMYWYDKIRTKGDPKVRFSGFDLKKTGAGSRVQLKASSYDKDLVSAVSSLSESKLNALGLCISIATNLKAQTPFDFLIIDDPIQSWDKDHETRFIEVIRELVQGGKQVVLLSHNAEWIKQVRQACLDLNGRFYEITGYTEVGPYITEHEWAEPAQRLKTIDAILTAPESPTTNLQHAEEEIRIVIHQLTCHLYKLKTGIDKSPHDLNSEKTRQMLLKCGLNVEFVNKIVAVFKTVDDAHHDSAHYAAARERIRTYHGLATHLKQVVDDEKQKPVKAATVTK